MQLFLFFKQFLVKNYRRCRRFYIKIHGTIAFTATVPLLNLNLNYEKLRHKDNKFYLLNNIHCTNFCVFKYQNLFSVLFKGYFCLQISHIA